MLTPKQLSDFSVALKKLFNLSEDHDLPVTVLKMNSKVAHFRLDLPVAKEQVLLMKELYVAVDMEPPKEVVKIHNHPESTKVLASAVRVAYWWAHPNGGRNGYTLNPISFFFWDENKFV